MYILFIKKKKKEEEETNCPYMKETKKTSDSQVYFCLINHFFFYVLSDISFKSMSILLYAFFKLLKNSFLSDSVIILSAVCLLKSR